MAEIHIYGKLRGYTRDLPNDPGGVVRIAPESGETVASILARLGIPGEDVYSIFFNHKLLATRTKMALWIGHQPASESPLDWDLDTPVTSDDRIGLFGRDMAALVV